MLSNDILETRKPRELNMYINLFFRQVAKTKNTDHIRKPLYEFNDIFISKGEDGHLRKFINHPLRFISISEFNFF